MAAEAIPAGAREFEEAAPAFGEAAPEPSTGATIIGEVVGSFMLSFLGIGIRAAAFGSGQFARGDSRVGTATLLGHAPVLPTALARRDGRGNADIDLVMGDMGGTMYDDDNTAQANLTAIRDSRLRDLAERNVEFRPESLYADVRPTLEVLATRYRLSIASNNSSPIQEALCRDGLLDYFSVIATPETSGADKTDAAFWRWALEHGGASPEPAVVTSFSGLPSALAGMATSRVPAGAV